MRVELGLVRRDYLLAVEVVGKSPIFALLLALPRNASLVCAHFVRVCRVHHLGELPSMAFASHQTLLQLLQLLQVVLQDIDLTTRFNLR